MVFDTTFYGLSGMASKHLIYITPQKSYLELSKERKQDPPRRTLSHLNLPGFSRWLLLCDLLPFCSIMRVSEFTSFQDRVHVCRRGFYWCSIRLGCRADRHVITKEGKNVRDVLFKFSSQN